MIEQIIKFLEVPTIDDDCKLGVIEQSMIPFPLRRLYYIYNSKPDLPRGHHAHKNTEQALFCLQGSTEILLDDGKNQDTVLLNTPTKGILIEKMIWHEMHKLDSSTILLVLASNPYNEADYIRNYEEFLRLAGEDR